MFVFTPDVEESPVPSLASIPRLPASWELRVLANESRTCKFFVKSDSESSGYLPRNCNQFKWVKNYIWEPEWELSGVQPPFPPAPRSWVWALSACQPPPPPLSSPCQGSFQARDPRRASPPACSGSARYPPGCHYWPLGHHCNPFQPCLQSWQWQQGRGPEGEVLVWPSPGCPPQLLRVRPTRAQGLCHLESCHSREATLLCSHQARVDLCLPSSAD